jgi:hypothetical protein
MTWSQVSSDEGNRTWQYWQRWSSRKNTLRRENAIRTR